MCGYKCVHTIVLILCCSHYPGFVEGFVLWDDEDINNMNAHGGVLPDGTYGENTLMKYCCR